MSFINNWRKSVIDNYIDPETANIIFSLTNNSHKNKMVSAYIYLLLSYDEINRLQDVVDKLNSATGLRTRVGRLMDWRNGARPCPKGVSAHMRKTILQHMFSNQKSDLLIKLLALD